MIDHLVIHVSNIENSGQFYDKALKTIGYKNLYDAPVEFNGRMSLGWEDSNKAELYITESSSTEPKIHLAFRAENRDQVDAFYKAAIAAGGTDNGKPGLRPEYHENYYGAFVLDPDGHNIEAVCHKA